MMLSILICTLPERKEGFNELLRELYYQKDGLDMVEILTDDSPKQTKTIGAKRNDLLSRASGKYVCFIDDDDMISKDYINDLYRGCISDSDCLSLRGVITWDGTNPELFEHSVKYKEWRTTTGAIKYERYPNHLSCIKSEIAKQFKFPDINNGEDHDWSTQVFKSGLIQSEYYIDKVLYNYQFKPNK